MKKETFHHGEIHIQQKAGEVLAAQAIGRIIDDRVPERVNRFIEKQSIALLCSHDDFNDVWVSVLVGIPGFLSLEDERTLKINRKELRCTESDIFYENLLANKEIGCLLIDLSTRRRYRINGKGTFTSEQVYIEIIEAYPNCPKYIQQRNIVDRNLVDSADSIISRGSALNQHIYDWIAGADTFFIGTKSDTKKLDVSHRGGPIGFIEINENILKVPDYKGNSMYNTLGNIYQNNQAGLLFIDFKNGNTLQLTGTAAVVFDQNSKIDISKTGGTGRYLLFTVVQWIITENHHDIAWEYLGDSPYNP